MWNLIYLAAVVLAFVPAQSDEALRAFDRSRITINNTGKPIPLRPTFIEAGPETGRVLNLHYFPAIDLYDAGRYSDAEDNLSYLIDRPDYIDGNVRKPEYLSTACYLRAMIYFYHASGLGRHSLARRDFEAAVKWNPKNYLAYIELSHVYSNLGFNDQAVAILDHLLKLQPDRDIAAEAQNEIHKLTAK
jgi:tetratricopeptide (TPR) repeat protein